MPIITNLKRVGRFQIHIKIIETAKQEQLKALFGEMIVTRAEMLLHTGCIDYVAISDFFEPVGPGQQMPIYQFEYKGSGKWEAKRVKSEFDFLDKS